MIIKINKTELKIALMLAPFFTFAVGFKWPLLGLFVIAGRYAVLLILIMLLFYKKKLGTFINEKVMLYLTLFYGVLIVSTVLNGGSITSAMQLAMYGLVPFLVFLNYWEKKKGICQILGGINIVFACLIVLNGIIMLVYPAGIYSTHSAGTETAYYLFGAKNQMVAPLLSGMCFFVEYSFQKYRKVTYGTILKSLICIGELIFGGSGTGLTMIFIFIVLVIFQKKRKKMVRTTASFVLIPTLFFLIVIFRLQNIFAFFIEGVLGKSLTLTNRTYIWDAALLSIGTHPVIGIGVSKTMAGYVHLVLSYKESDTFAHDMYLDIMVMGGILALVLFTAILLMVKKHYDAFVKRNLNHSFIWWGFWLYLLASLVDIYIGNYCMFIFIAYIVAMNKNSKLYAPKVSNTEKINVDSSG